MANKTEFPICTNTGIHGAVYLPATVVWTDRRNGNDDVYGATLSGVTPPAAAPTSNSTYAFAATAAGGWRNSDQTVTISASGGTPPLTINYSLDGGVMWQTVLGAYRERQGRHRDRTGSSTSASCAGAAEVRHDAGDVDIYKTRP